MGNDHGKHEAHHSMGHHVNKQPHNTKLKTQIEANYQYLTKSRLHESNPVLLMTDFENIFYSCPALGRLLYENFLKENETDGIKTLTEMSKSQFIQAANRILELTTHSNPSDFYFQLFSAGKSTLTKPEFYQLIDVCIRISLTLSKCDTNLICRSSHLEDTPEIQAIHKSMFGNNTNVSKDDFMHWCGRHMPRLLHDLHPFVCAALCAESLIQETAASPLPTTLQHVLDNKYLLTLPTLWALNTYVPHDYTNNIESRHAKLSDMEHGHHNRFHNKHTLGDILSEGGWHPLYDSNSQGLSMNRFKHHVLCYSAPTITFLQFEGHIYCLGSDVGWRDSTERWGDCDCFLMQIHPQHRVIQAGASMLYMNTENRKSLKGVQVGKDAVTTILHIDDDFEKVKHYGVQLPLQSIEVWGCGSQSSLDVQQEQQVWEKQEAERNKNRKLKPGNWKDNPDKELLEMGGVTTYHAQR